MGPGVRRFAVVSWALVVAFGAMAARAAATTFTPNRFDDPSSGGTHCGPPAVAHGCSLRGAIAAAHGGDVVELSVGTYVLTQDSLPIAHAMAIIGAGPQETTIQQTSAHGVIDDTSGVQLTMQGLTISGGDVVGAPGNSGGSPGAAGAAGGDASGGGIFTLGPLTLTDVVVTGNQVIGGAGGIGADGSSTKAGGDGGSGGSASGAGIDAGPSLTLIRVAITNNIAQAGDAGSAGNGGSTTAGGTGGAAGPASGGGIELGGASTLTATNTLIAGNQANSTTGGDGGAGGTSSGKGGAGGQGEPGDGGGLFSNGVVNLTNVTLSGNTASGSDGGHGGFARSSTTATKGGAGGVGSGGNGGAIALFNGAQGRFASLTIAGNSAGHGAGGAGGSGSHGGAKGTKGDTFATEGGNVFVYNATANMRGSIIASGNADAGTQNCTVGGGGTFTSLGYNLEDSDQCLTPAAAGDITDTPAGLGPLQDNGGATQTMALLPGSAAIRVGQSPCVNLFGQPLTTDQRGLPRHSSCDIGAFEGQPPVPKTTPTVTGTAASGTAITCAPGTFGGDLPQTSGFVWLRDGAAIAGATSTQYAVTAGDVGQQLACRQTVLNAFGTATGTSNTVTGHAGSSGPGNSGNGGPKLTGLKLSPSKFRTGHGTTITFTLGVAASVSFVVQRREPGVRSGKRCVAPSKKHRHGKRCTRLVRAHGAPHTGTESAGSVRLKWKPHGLKPGKYELTATPSGGHSATAAFTIQKRRRKR
jgi:hypothetical protein